jgi:hypothetical protein
MLDRPGRKRRGAFDTPRDLARDVVQAALQAAERPPVTALDPACGTGAFLVALTEAGLPTICGTDLDPRALAVAQVAAPGAHLAQQDGMAAGDRMDIVVGNPPFVSPEHQDKAARAALRERFPWLGRRFDLAVPFAAAAMERVRPGGGLALVLPASVLVEPYGEGLRRRWLTGHTITALGPHRPFPGAAVNVAVVGLRAHGAPAPLPGGPTPDEVLSLPAAPLDASLQPGDSQLVADVRARSFALGDWCEVDTGVVSHGPLGGKARLLHDGPGPGRVPYVDSRDLQTGRRQWLRYAPEEMHRPKRPALFTGPKILVQRLRGRGPVRAWIDRDGLYAGHTLTVVRPLNDTVPLEEILALLTSPLVDGLVRIERGDRLDLYPVDVRSLPVPIAWRTDPGVPLATAWGLSPKGEARLRARTNRPTGC